MASSLHESIANSVRLQVEQGELPPGAALPTEMELARTYGVARDTVRKALAILQQEGLIVTAQGRPTRVRAPADQWRWRDVMMLGPWDVHVREQGRYAQQVASVSTQPAPAPVAERLQLEPGTWVVHRHERRLVDDAVQMVVDAWYPLEVATGTPLMASLDEVDPVEVLAAQGRPIRTVTTELTARMAAPADVQMLDLRLGAPVGELVQTGVDSAGRPVQVTVTVYDADQVTLVHDHEATA